MKSNVHSVFDTGAFHQIFHFSLVVTFCTMHNPPRKIIYLKTETSSKPEVLDNMAKEWYTIRSPS